ncbi:hypothetical protein QN409_08740, partial [Pseudomonas sp. MH9.3]|nr:hypothetical protein [Pseudomonas sp. MH9.3]
VSGTPRFARLGALRTPTRGKPARHNTLAHHKKNARHNKLFSHSAGLPATERQLKHIAIGFKPFDKAVRVFG